MNKKICGQKNELNEIEKNDLQKKLNNEYKIYTQLGYTGERTSAYLMKDKSGQEFVVKIPNDEYDSKWLISQKDTLGKCRDALKEYNGTVYIPKDVIIGDGFIIEPYAGAELTSELYEILSEDKKETISNDLAYFLFYLHTNNNIGDVLPLYMLNNPALEEVFSYFQTIFNENQKPYIAEKIKCFHSRNITDEISVMTHADIRSQNILYDEKQKRLAIIDFELIKKRNIYHDFVPFAAASFKLPYKMLFATVNKYNSISGNSAVSVDLNKVKLFHELGVFHEYGRCAMYRKKEDIGTKYIMG